eukprot:875126-Rhodomonas_salina.4
MHTRSTRRQLPRMPLTLNPNTSNQTPPGYLKTPRSETRHLDLKPNTPNQNPGNLRHAFLTHRSDVSRAGNGRADMADAGELLAVVGERAHAVTGDAVEEPVQ